MLLDVVRFYLLGLFEAKVLPIEQELCKPMRKKNRRPSVALVDSICSVRKKLALVTCSLKTDPATMRVQRSKPGSKVGTLGEENPTHSRAGSVQAQASRG